MRKVLAIAAIAVTIGLASCDAPASREPSAPAPLAYEPPAPITREPLPPPAGYEGAPTTSSSSSTNAGEATQLGWHASPRWAAIKGNDILVEPNDQ